MTASFESTLAASASTTFELQISKLCNKTLMIQQRSTVLTCSRPNSWNYWYKLIYQNYHLSACHSNAMGLAPCSWTTGHQCNMQESYTELYRMRKKFTVDQHFKCLCYVWSSSNTGIQRSIQYDWPKSRWIHRQRRFAWYACIIGYDDKYFFSHSFKLNIVFIFRKGHMYLCFGFFYVPGDFS